MEEIVIVGAGISGLSTALGLHRLGIRSLVLESSDGLRVSGFALSAWTNAWKALDALGIADPLRKQHKQIHGALVSSLVSANPPGETTFSETEGGREVRCVQRSVLLESLAKELPEGSIRFSSKVVCIEEESGGWLKVVHLADGTVIKAKGLIGCDGVNSVVARWLGFKEPAFTSRSAIRGFAHFEDGHGFQPKILQFFGHGTRSGFIPCDDKIVYWFFTCLPSKSDEDLDLGALKRLVLHELCNLPDNLKNVIEITSVDNITSSPLRFRPPWQVLRGNISKHNVCVAGDALHPMTPDIGQGGCSALEDGVVLARCMGEALLTKKPGTDEGGSLRENDEYKRIEMGMRKYAKERKWRSFDLISTAYMVGFIQQSSGKLMSFLRDRVLSSLFTGLLLKKANFDCGKLVSAS